MPQKVNSDNLDQETLKKKLEDLIRKKTEENDALKKLLDGLNSANSFSKKENK